jgi:hypothetical protein
MNGRSARTLLVATLMGAAATTAMAATAVGCSGAERERYEPRSFLGYACADDCREHKWGFAWAVRRRVATSAACGGLHGAASEGCRAYVEEGLAPEAAGSRWALENEVVRRCDCDGAGARFRAGCLRQLEPTNT